MPSITSEVNTTGTPLRCLVDEYKPLLDSWRSQLRSELTDQARWLLPPNKQRASIAGLALDYRARWFLAGVDQLPPAVEHGLEYCTPATVDAINVAHDGARGLGPGVHPPETEVALARVAAACATVEPLFRRGPIVPCPLDALGYEEFLDQYADVIGDVVRLGGVLPDLLGDEIGRRVEPGPILGCGRLSGDGDLLVDDTLMEVKCVSNPMSESAKTLRQVLVYSARAGTDHASLVLPRQKMRVDFDLTAHRNQLDHLDDDIVRVYGSTSRPSQRLNGAATPRSSGD